MHEEDFVLKKNLMQHKMSEASVSMEKSDSNQKFLLVVHLVSTV